MEPGTIIVHKVNDQRRVYEVECLKDGIVCLIPIGSENSRLYIPFALIADCSKEGIVQVLTPATEDWTKHDD